MKKTLVIILALVLCMSFAACGSSGGDIAPAPSAPADIPTDQTGAAIPVLMGGALPFTGMESVTNENYPDGSYYYEDMTEDGMISVINTAFANTGEEGQSPEEYAAAAAVTLAGDAEVSDLVCTLSEEYTEALSYPVYIAGFDSGANEDTRTWTVFMTCTDTYTYLYAFNVWADYEEDMSDVFASVFSQLTLQDAE